MSPHSRQETSLIHLSQLDGWRPGAASQSSNTLHFKAYGCGADKSQSVMKTATKSLKTPFMALQSSAGSWHQSAGHEDLMVGVSMSPQPPAERGTEWMRPPAGKSRAAHSLVYAVFPQHAAGPSVAPAWQKQCHGKYYNEMLKQSPGASLISLIISFDHKLMILTAVVKKQKSKQNLTNI